jgi:glycosyltransferase involved in cell wall biosynthesis
LLVSIITVTYNAEQFLERTIRSIIGQTYPHIEYLIIDGASTDGTLAIIQQYEKHISVWISEPDRGLYDAMNKGLTRASGKYVWFMNAGDEIHDAHTLERIAAKFSENGDVYYGDALFVSPDNRELGLRSVLTPHKLPLNLSWRDMRLGMVVCHQSFIVRRSIAPPYEPAYRYSADVDWEIKCLKRAGKVVFVEGVLSRYLTGGFSRKHLRKSLLDRYAVLQKHFGTLGALKNHLLIAARGISFMWKKRGKYW